jgi:hypothetical protein
MILINPQIVSLFYWLYYSTANLKIGDSICRKVIIYYVISLFLEKAIFKIHRCASVMCRTIGHPQIRLKG